MTDAAKASAPKGMRKAARKRINLALQGGGAHGAFTWGVLDGLLEDDRLDIVGISGTSAGAVNAVALADGLMEGGPEGARRQLERFWRAVSYDGHLSTVQRTIFDQILAPWGGSNGQAGFFWFDMFSKVASPYDFNPLDINPIRDILEREIDFPRLRASSGVKLFVAATNVISGKIEVFEGKTLTSAHILASACLPQVFRAVEIDGVPYWDGGYSGNPALFPLFYSTDTPDVLLVQVNPVERREVPRTARAIQDRMNEIVFNSSLLREMRAIDFVTRLIDAGTLDPAQYMRVNLHRIDADSVMHALQASTKMNAEWGFLTKLRDAGRASAQAFLANHFDAIGSRSSFDLREAYN